VTLLISPCWRVWLKCSALVALKHAADRFPLGLECVMISVSLKDPFFSERSLIRISDFFSVHVTAVSSLPSSALKLLPLSPRVDLRRFWSSRLRSRNLFPLLPRISGCRFQGSVFRVESQRPSLPSARPVAAPPLSLRPIGETLLQQLKTITYHPNPPPLGDRRRKFQHLLLLCVRESCVWPVLAPGPTFFLSFW